MSEKEWVHFLALPLDLLGGVSDVYIHTQQDAYRDA